MNTTMVRLSGVQPISTVEQGGAAILQLVDAPAFAGESGLYFNGMQEIARRSQAYDENARRRLRALSFDLAGLADPLAGPGQIGTRRPSLTLVVTASSTARRSGNKGAPEPPGAGIHRVLIAPHICWRCQPWARLAESLPCTNLPIGHERQYDTHGWPPLWEPTKWI